MSRNRNVLLLFGANKLGYSASSIMPALAWQWLREQEAFARNESIASIWESTDTRWMLVRKSTLAQKDPESSIAPVYENRDWILLRSESETR